MMPANIGIGTRVLVSNNKQGQISGILGDKYLVRLDSGNVIRVKREDVKLIEEHGDNI